MAKSKGQVEAKGETEVLSPGQMNELEIAAERLFSDSQSNYTLANGREVIVSPCKMMHLSVIMDFFKRLTDRVDPEQFGALLQTVVDAQTKNVTEGRQPNDMGAMTIGEMIKKGLGNASLTVMLIGAIADELPRLAAPFTNLSSDEIAHLDVDEGMEVASRIVMVNYDFFTQKLLPVLQAFVARWAAARIVAMKKARNAQSVEGK